ncbi:MAG TPA: 16S rRNA (cytidine(1402)-2'-O)-methyltransferase [Solirubrobacteraceae bacterium]|jgi:16S rRNA (cytidine1402-2'-O)-methyltransferase
MDSARAPVGAVVVCPTPIGNLQDVTLRTLQALREADVIACEDTRRTGLLLSRHGLRGEQTTLVSLHEHNERERAEELLERVRAGDRVALVSDAGMPLISDPGFELVRGAIAAGLPLEVLPGPSAVSTALVASGLPAGRFQFIGFLPRARAALTQLLAGNAETLVAFESPRRLTASLALLAELDGERPLSVCRELTKLHEEVARGSASELAGHFAEVEPRGEIVVVIGAAPALEPGVERAVAAVEELVAAGARPRAAARTVAQLTGTSANALYDLALAAARDGKDR